MKLVVTFIGKLFRLFFLPYYYPTVNTKKKKNTKKKTGSDIYCKSAK